MSIERTEENVEQFESDMKKIAAAERRAQLHAKHRKPTPKIQVDLDPVSVSNGQILGPMGEYYGTLKNASPEFRLRLMKAVNAYDTLISTLKRVEAYTSLNMATPPPLLTTQDVLIEVRRVLEEHG